MNHENELPKRKKNRLENYDYSSCGAYFITVCTLERKFFKNEYGRPLVAPTMSRVIKQLKGIVSKQIGIGIWQKSFHDHIIRNRNDYEEHVKYIYENPIRWRYDELYIEE